MLSLYCITAIVLRAFCDIFMVFFCWIKNNNNKKLALWVHQFLAAHQRFITTGFWRKRKAHNWKRSLRQRTKANGNDWQLRAPQSWKPTLSLPLPKIHNKPNTRFSRENLFNIQSLSWVSETNLVKFTAFFFFFSSGKMMTKIKTHERLSQQRSMDVTCMVVFFCFLCFPRLRGFGRIFNHSYPACAFFFFFFF